VKVNIYLKHIYPLLIGLLLTIKTLYSKLQLLR
jgi:hypothetical protein